MRQWWGSPLVQVEKWREKELMIREIIIIIIINNLSHFSSFIRVFANIEEPMIGRGY
jgi:hypothetical protein